MFIVLIARWWNCGQYLFSFFFLNSFLFSILFYNRHIWFVQFKNILHLKSQGHLFIRTVLVVAGVRLLNQLKCDVGFEIFLVFLLLSLGFLNLTQKTEGTNDLSISFFMPLQIDFTPKLQCLSTQWTQRNTDRKIEGSERVWWFREWKSLPSINRFGSSES